MAKESSARLSNRKVWAILALVFISMVLRPPVAAVGPILRNIISDLGLTPFQSGLLAALPVLCFGLGAFAAPWLVRKLGLDNAFTAILLTLAVGIALRGLWDYSILLIGSLVVGLAIALSNVLLPTMIRAEFPDRISQMTAIYTSLLALFASVGATLAVPVMQVLKSWQGSLAIWAIPAAIAVFAWLMMNRKQHHQNIELDHVQTSGSSIWKSPITWAIVGFFGLQSMNFYSILNWLPTILVSKGFTVTEAGSLLGLTTLVGIPAGLAITTNLPKFKSVPALAVIISVVTSLGMLMLLGHGWLAIAGCVVVGLGLASSFPLSLALIAIKATTQERTTQLSAISQGAGYLIAAIGTFAVGASQAVFGNWTVAILFLAAGALGQASMGAYAGSNRKL
ncbi:MAG: MFS transporter [Micrococcales bacterium]